VLDGWKSNGRKGKASGGGSQLATGVATGGADAGNLMNKELRVGPQSGLDDLRRREVLCLLSTRHTAPESAN
jgi:hypothetical protein